MDKNDPIKKLCRAYNVEDIADVDVRMTLPDRT